MGEYRDIKLDSQLTDMKHQTIDYDEIFSPFGHFEIVRILLSLDVIFSQPIYQFGVKSTFLNGDLEEKAYFNQHEDFVISGNERKVYKLKKAHYRLKLSWRAWYNQINSYFLRCGFEKSENEPTLYVIK